jgi:Zn ribbon nucleic-acid-binding protein
MAQVFHPSANTISKVTIFGGVFIVGAVGWALSEINRSPWITEAQVARGQPVEFSHKHHVQGLGIDCRFCHAGVEETQFAGIPPTSTCMGCHSQVWKDAPALEAVRESFRTDRSIEWVRVHDLPDFVYFDHSIHVKKGVGCESCHGRVDEMPLTWRENSLNMEWCLQCHRDPAAFLRPKDKVFTMGWDPEKAEPPRTQRAVGEEIARENHVQNLTNCSVCHR